MMHVSQIWQYPVKSMIGATVDRADLIETGLVGDRTRPHATRCAVAFAGRRRSGR